MIAVLHSGIKAFHLSELEVSSKKVKDKIGRSEIDLENREKILKARKRI